MSSAGPLAGTRVVVTRPAGQAAAFSGLLEASGAQVIEIPTIEITDPPDWAPLDAALAALESYGTAVFTSANTVNRLADRMKRQGSGIEALSSLKLVAIGPMTAKELTRLGLEVSIIPGEYRAEALLEAIAAAAGGSLEKARIFLPRALEAREVLPEGLRLLGAEVDVVPVYQTVIPDGADVLVAAALRQGVDLVTFTSSSSVRNFLKLGEPQALARGLQGVAIGCIGPITAKTATDAGLTVSIQPGEYTIKAFHQAVLDHFSGRDARR